MAARPARPATPLPAVWPRFCPIESRRMGWTPPSDTCTHSRRFRTQRADTAPTGPHTVWQTHTYTLSGKHIQAHTRTHTRTHTHTNARAWRAIRAARKRKSATEATARTHTHTRTHAHTHARTKARIQRIRTDTSPHTCTHAHMHTCTHAHMHTCTHTHMHTCTHAQARTQAHIQHTQHTHVQGVQSW